MANTATGKARVSLPQSWVDFPDRGYIDKLYPTKVEVNTAVGNIVNGTTKVGKSGEADIATNLKENAKIGNELVALNKTNEKNFAKIGWYRVAEITDENTGVDSNFSMRISSRYSNATPTNIIMNVLKYGTASFSTILHVSEISFIDKVRLVRMDTRKLVVDIHIKYNENNRVAWSIEGLRNIVALQGDIVEDIPSKALNVMEIPLQIGLTINGNLVATTKSTVYRGGYRQVSTPIKSVYVTIGKEKGLIGTTVDNVANIKRYKVGDYVFIKYELIDTGNKQDYIYVYGRIVSVTDNSITTSGMGYEIFEASLTAPATTLQAYNQGITTEA